jgi:hypothetical protein
MPLARENPETIRSLLEAGGFFLKSFHETSTSKMRRERKLSFGEAN